MCRTSSPKRTPSPPSTTTESPTSDRPHAGHGNLLKHFFNPTSARAKMIKRDKTALHRSVKQVLSLIKTGISQNGYIVGPFQPAILGLNMSTPPSSGSNLNRLDCAAYDWLHQHGIKILLLSGEQDPKASKAKRCYILFLIAL